MSSLYQCRTEKDKFRIVKFDDKTTLDVVAVYYIWSDKRNRSQCDCPGGHLPMCRHRANILPLFLKHKKVNTGWFLRYLNEDHYQWEPPINRIKLGG